MSFYEKKVSSWSDLIEAIDGFLTDHGKPDEIWFRGVAKSAYTLTPALLRYEDGAQKERRLFDLYTNALPGDPGRRDSDWGLLFDMQHYGVPTRLLDWTKSLGVAVFFALRDDEIDSPSIYLLRPLLLNGKNGNKLVEFVPDKEDFKYREIYCPLEDEARMKGPLNVVTYPLAISPRFPNSRIQRQQGVFTIHGKSTAPLEEQCPEVIGKITLEKRAQKEAEGFLSIANLNHFSLFPDMVGMARYVRASAGLKPFPIYREAQRRLFKRLHDILEEDAVRLSQMSQLRSNSGARIEAREFHIKGISGCNIGADFVSRKDIVDKLWDWFNSPDDDDTPKPHFFISGEAGTGKTNLLFYLVTEDERFKKKPAIFVSFKDLDLERGIEDYLFQYAFPGEEFESEHYKSALKNALIEGKVLLILDGIDELARTKGDKAVIQVVKQIDDLVKKSKRRRVVITCRDHILRTLQKVGALNPDRRHAAHLERLKLEDVRPKIEALVGDGTDPEILRRLIEHARLPFFYQIIRLTPKRQRDKLFGAAKSGAALYDAWYDVVLQQRGYKTAKAIEDMKRNVARVAAIMLNRRDDLITHEQLSEFKSWDPKNFEKIEMRPGQPYGIFVKEKKDTWGFVHQSLREFILAWATKREIEKGEYEVVTGTSAFDYVGAETYKHLSEMPGPRIQFDVRLQKLLRNRALDDEAWNNAIQNMLEAIGMLDGRNDQAAVANTVGTLLQIANGEAYRQRYVSYRTRYNAVRCIERLHQTSPKPYYLHVLGLEKREREQVEAAAVRGFQKKNREPGVYPRMVFCVDQASAPPESILEFQKLTRRVVNDLLRIITEIADKEIHTDAQYLKLNCTFALVRWIPDGWNKWNVIQNLLKTKLRDKWTHLNMSWLVARKCPKEKWDEFRDLFDKLGPEDSDLKSTVKEHPLFRRRMKR
jgi:hypothetical protein